MGYCHTSASAIFLLADGLGGHPAGEVAAELALHAIAGMYEKQARPLLQDVRAFMGAAIMVAHRRILQYADERRLPDSPRTTLVLAVVQGGVAHWVHCGDSRLYFVRDGQLVSRTSDHSFLQLQQGDAGGAVASGQRGRNLLRSCLGSPSDPVYDVAGPVAILPGDKILLCSDGLWAALEDREIVDCLAAHDVSPGGSALVERALARTGAGSDNVTVLAMEWAGRRAKDGLASSFADSRRSDSSVFSSTLQIEVQDNFSDDFDDAAIERSITEINEAIRRNVQRPQS